MVSINRVCMKVTGKYQIRCQYCPPLVGYYLNLLWNTVELKGRRDITTIFECCMHSKVYFSWPPKLGFTFQNKTFMQIWPSMIGPCWSWLHLLRWLWRSVSLVFSLSLINKLSQYTIRGLRNVTDKFYFSIP